MPKCYVCKKEITEKSSTEEHILLNSIGGKLKSSNLICKSCNSIFGSDVDSELSKQLNFLSSILMIKRDRGNPPPVLMDKKSTGEQYFVDHKGKPTIKNPVVEQNPVGDNINIKIHARSMKEARDILNGLKGKYGNIDVDNILEKAKVVQEPIDEMLEIKLCIGGKESMPAILKMAINYYVEKTQDPDSIQSAIDDLKNNNSQKVEPVIFANRLYDLEPNEVTHSIFLCGSRESNKLYAIIELFNTVQFLVKLANDFVGDTINVLYVFDVLSREEKTKALKNVPTADFVFNFSYPNSNPDFSIMQGAMERVLAIAMQRQHSFQQGEIIDKAWMETIDKLIPSGQPVTKEAHDKFVEKVSQDLTQYIMRTNRRNTN